LATMPGYSFSTMWNLRRHRVGRKMIEEIKGLGFESVELNYNVTEELLETIVPMIEKGGIRISSVHNVFPFIADKDYDTDSVMLGFDDEEKRRRSVELLIGSIDYAHRFNAQGVVIHPGEVPIDPRIDSELKRIWTEQGKNSPAYGALWAELRERRDERAPQYVRRIAESLEQVCEYIARKGLDVKLGLETRSRCYQIPTLREADEIMTSLQGAPVYLWYDIGHGTIMERMGLYENGEELLRLKDKVLGVHIHETVGLVDHWCPYVQSGDDRSFDRFLEVIDAAPLKVFELRAQNTPEEIEASCGILTEKMTTLRSAVQPGVVSEERRMGGERHERVL